MYVSNATQNRASSYTGSIAGIRLPNFNADYVYSKKKSGSSDSEYKKAIVEQAIKDQAAGKFQNESYEFVQLMKSYVSEVSPDRESVIKAGLQKIAKNNAAGIEPLNLMELLLNDGKVKYQKDSNAVTYAEFYDSNGEMVATYSNNGWTMFTTNAEAARQTEMCLTYSRAWNTAKQASQGSSQLSNISVDGVEETGNTFNMQA
ncbi:hypothetical protein [Konateibacter massiliensis]|uniref:hypothetical protein n=1 Tax=Konateibacter massiliensis TaxID=2002841 RepID=UPI000C14642B|nr:hypothetical protein [Konateibacter massiliensis]